jgi:hypothetical protein
MGEGRRGGEAGEERGERREERGERREERGERREKFSMEGAPKVAGGDVY